MDRKTRQIHIISLALAIAILPPVWAVLAPYIDISTGAVALICAGVYVTNGNKQADAVRMVLGFLAGDIWAILAIGVMELLPWNPNAELYLTLFAFGALAVLIGENLPRLFFTPAWLCGWAIGLTIMGPLSFASLGTLPVQIGAAMIVGVVYVGIGVDAFQRLLIRLFGKGNG